MFSYKYSKVLGTAFFIEYPWRLLSNLVFKEEFKEKKVSGDIAFALISLFHVQVEKPASRSTTLKAFVFLAKFAEFCYHKKFETRSP